MKVSGLSPFDTKLALEEDDPWLIVPAADMLLNNNAHSSMTAGGRSISTWSFNESRSCRDVTS